MSNQADTEVLIVGSFVQDLSFRSVAFPRPGETVVGTFSTGPGGKGSNQAVAAARSGARTAFVGAVGRDAFGEEVRRFYAAEGIDGRFATKPDAATGAAGILVDDEGENEIVVALGANLELSTGDVPWDLVNAARIVVCQHEIDLATNARVLVHAREHGRTTVLNPAPMRPDFDADVLSYVDILVPNEMEFAALAGLDPETVVNMPAVELEAQARSLGVPTVIITLGVRGCLVSTPGRHALLPAHTGIEVVDTTGAGDAFVGGFAAGYVRLDGDLFGAAAWGNAAAALCVGRPGTAPAMPLENEVAELLESSTGPE